ncbi:MAG: GntR family transcriptional regulator [Bacillota bacterium]
MAETKYNKVKSWIKSKILDGTYAPKQRISSESELMKRFDVSRHTVRIAIGELVSEGWLYREQGAGTFCSDRQAISKEVGHSDEKKIAIITTYISDYIFPSIIRGAEAVIRENGYQVSLFSTNNNYETEKAILETIISQRFDGVIIEPTKSAASSPNINYYLNMELLGIPYIMINAYYDELEPISVVMDDEKGGFLQAEHLIKLGHRNIAGFFQTDDMQGVKRMKGFLKAFRMNGITINPQNIITYNSSEKSIKAVEIFKGMLNNSVEKPTGLVCYNDELAMKLLDVIRRKGMTVPEDISMVGFDNSFFAEVSEVKLTSINHPKSELGKKAAEMIIEMFTKEESPKRWQDVEPVVFDAEIVLRNSSKRLVPVEDEKLGEVEINS